jgi:hypothetical protein
MGFFTGTSIEELARHMRPLSVKQADAYFFDIDGTLLVTRDLVHWNALHL